MKKIVFFFIGIVFLFLFLKQGLACTSFVVHENKTLNAMNGDADLSPAFMSLQDEGHDKTVKLYFSLNGNLSRRWKVLFEDKMFSTRDGFNKNTRIYFDKEGIPLTERVSYQVEDQNVMNLSTRIMCLGNSITRGKYETTYRLYLRPKLDSMEVLDSVDLVGSSFQPPSDVLDYDSVWSGFPEAYQMLEGDVEHEGHGGYTIKRLEDLPIEDRINDYQPDILLLMAGTNDVPVHYEGAIDRLDQLVEKILENLDGFLLVSTIPPQYGSGGEEKVEVILFNAEIRELIKYHEERGEKIQLVDAYALMDQSSIHEDGSHTSVKGNKEIAKAFYDGIKALTALPAPYSLQIASDGDNNLHIEWEDSSRFDENFLIERSTAEPEGFKVIDTVLSGKLEYLDTTVEKATKYYYRLQSFNRFVKSNYSGTIPGEVVGDNDTSMNLSHVTNGKNTVWIYPNPACKTLRVEFSKELPNKENVLKIYDMNGKLFCVKSLARGTRSVSIDVSGFSRGMCFLTIDGFINQMKVIIK